MSKKRVVPRAKRLRWFQEARFGLFVHWGLYSQVGRHEWAMNRERISPEEYEPLADTWKPKRGAPRAWARLARQAGMRYVVLTAKHHEGFCLWDTHETDYSAPRRGPGRDLVAEYVEACRGEGLKVGLYYSLMDWHHPDGTRSWKHARARRRFMDYTSAQVRELMTGYGRIDLLWYDYAWPLKGAKAWESVKRNAMVRRLQPHILINNRGWTEEDFGTPEEKVEAAQRGRAWEACMTFNGAWGSMPCARDWRSARDVLRLLRECAGGGGNLLLNIGPAPDGSVPPEAVERLVPVGKWLARHGEAVYGKVDRTDGRFEFMPCGEWTTKGRTAYFWVFNWPGREIAIGGLRAKVRRASLVGSGKSVRFEQAGDRLLMRGLPATCPDRALGVAVIRLECASRPRQVLGPGLTVPRGLSWPK